MTVYELIDFLKGADPLAEVFIETYSCGETFREPLTGEWLEFHNIDDKRAVVIDAAIN